ncbi:hypothetical protein EKO27_g2747 [Xylaria grammica]|uniref:Rhodopsin domain-containing protein n=1 Tax=Xylaria grammica TaxID=363999 RepID=A0A439DD59_9PEZI|nr:hypothetical protein EKO27_g2747 [Xylaria grammica]
MDQNLARALRAEGTGVWVRNVTTAMVVLSTLFVALRFLARKVQRLTIGIDDYLILAGQTTLFAAAGLTFGMIHNGLGTHADTVSNERLTNFLKLLLAFECVYVTVIFIVKISILRMYIRIFASRDFKLAARVVEGIVLAWWLSIALTCIFQCNPVSKAWLPLSPGKCINLKAFFYGNALPNILTDIIILSLPIRQVLKLQTGKANKLSISFIFLLGSFVSFASIYRFTTLLVFNPLDATWTLAPSQAWCMIEISTGVVSACLPTMRPLGVRLAGMLGISTGEARPIPSNPVNLATFGSGGSSRKREESLHHSHFSRLDDDDEEPDSPEYVAGAGNPAKRSDEQPLGSKHYGRDPAVHAAKARFDLPQVR